MTTRMTRICLLLRSNSNTKHKEKLVKNIPHVTLHCCLHKTQSTATQIQIRSPPLLQFWVFLTLLATSSSRGSFTKKSLKLVVKYFKMPNYKKCIDCTYQKKNGPFGPFALFLYSFVSTTKQYSKVPNKRTCTSHRQKYSCSIVKPHFEAIGGHWRPLEVN